MPKQEIKSRRVYGKEAERQREKGQREKPGQILGVEVKFKQESGKFRYIPKKFS